MPLDGFHPAVAAWFRSRFEAPTDAQLEAWPAIRSGCNALLAAPTGSGKTLAAFLAVLDELVHSALTDELPERTRILYVSPLKALSNDIECNLQEPLNGIRDQLLQQGLPDVPIRAAVRTGDTSQAERARMRRESPHILVTTPESLYILLTSESGRHMLGDVRTVIVDEIHALAGNKRGAHLALSLQRLAALTDHPPVRVGLSATQKPIESMACFLTGSEKAAQACTIIDTGHQRDRDLGLEVPPSPLETIMSNEVWANVYDRLAQLISEHRSTLVFVNTRRLAERAARHLAERLGEEHVTAHHGSLARKHRLDAERRLKGGELKALVATASLELGIDIGEVDLVCQLGSPRSIATLVQRVGRSGHAVGRTPKGRLFPLSRDDLLECTALLNSVRAGELDRVNIPAQPVDVLAQQIVAEVACCVWDEKSLYQQFKNAWPYRNLSLDQFRDVTRMLADGFATQRGRRGAYLHRDAVNERLRGRRAARLTALMNGGAIPDQFDYDVILDPQGIRVGTLNEDFAFESLPGDIFQLGNTSYRILRVETGKVRVQDAKGQPPNIPFWFGEAPGRTDELSDAVCSLLGDINARLEDGLDSASAWLRTECALPEAAARQLAEYLGGARAALTTLPDRDTVVLERFFDEAGDLHLVIHSPFGSRLNRAWGLALRKRFCRKFNFELQAAALENSIVLSLGPTHSFPLDEVSAYLKSTSVRDVLEQALLAAPMFPTHWRWNATIALAVRRNRSNGRVPPQFQRTDAEDLLAVVFPDQLACLENIPTGYREIPDHPLVNQTMDDCLREVMDVDGLIHLLERLERGELKVVARDLNGPSPLSQEILNARPYTFLDDAPAEERRTLAVQSRGFTDPASAADLGRLDPDAIERVRDEAWPEPRDADELHDALVTLAFLSESEIRPGSAPLLQTLCDNRRCTLFETGAEKLWVAAERLDDFLTLWPDAGMNPAIDAISDPRGEPSEESARIGILRSRLEGLGPVSASALGAPLGFSQSQVEAALIALETEGFVIRGQFETDASTTQWCERRLLARIHRYTIRKLRSEIEPVSPQVFMRFLLRWHGLAPSERGEGEEALAGTLDMLEGFAAPAAAWESDILPARIRAYSGHMLDNLCATGRFAWLRRLPPRSGASPVRTTPIALVPRENLSLWQRATATDPELSSAAIRVRETLRQRGALFFTEIVRETGQLRTQAENALGELVATGLVSSDSFAGLRALITPASKRPSFSRRRRGRAAGVDRAGRWGLIPADPVGETRDQRHEEHVEQLVRVLLRRYGIVFRRLLDRESGLPSWRELLYVFRRLEARGEIRGGRFVEGFSGEQFAHPEALPLLRALRRKPARGELVTVSAADPLNLTGIVTPGERVPSQTGNRVVLQDGVPVAWQSGNDTHLSDTLDENAAWGVRQLLTRSRTPPSGFGRLRPH